jgi:hypothetical protein
MAQGGGVRRRLRGLTGFNAAPVVAELRRVWCSMIAGATPIWRVPRDPLPEI